jgi:uncharacterized protein (DUF2267 family)
MSATGLEVFDRTLQITHVWIDELSDDLGVTRRVAWHALGAVLRALRDRLPLNLSAHLASELPLLVRGAYFDQWHPAPDRIHIRSLGRFIELVMDYLGPQAPVHPRDAIEAVFALLDRHIDPGQAQKVYEALPEKVRQLWSGRELGMTWPDVDRDPARVLRDARL